jgi:hypothetical protein
MRVMRVMRVMRDWRDWRDWRYSRYWRETFFVEKITRQTISLLVVADVAEAIDLATVLLGRLISLQETQERGLTEIQRIAETAQQMLAKRDWTERELSEVLLDILRYLPARASDEIAFVRQLAEKAADQEQQEALLMALSHAHPDKDALPVLQAATASADTRVAQAAQRALDQELARQRR